MKKRKKKEGEVGRPSPPNQVKDMLSISKMIPLLIILVTSVNPCQELF